MTNVEHRVRAARLPHLDNLRTALVAWIIGGHALRRSRCPCCSCTAIATRSCRSAPRATARQHPAWSYVELAGVGHVPQLQVPNALTAHIVGWMAGIESQVSVGTGGLP